MKGLGVWHDLSPHPCLERPGWGALLWADHFQSASLPPPLMEPWRPRAMGPRSDVDGVGGPAVPRPGLRAAHSLPRQTASWLLACPCPALPGCSALFPALPGRGSPTNSPPAAPALVLGRAMLRLPCGDVESPRARPRACPGACLGNPTQGTQHWIGPGLSWVLLHSQLTKTCSAWPGRWDIAWNSLTRTRPGLGELGLRVTRLLGVQGPKSHLITWGGNPQVRPRAHQGNCHLCLPGTQPRKARPSPAAPETSSPKPSLSSPLIVWPPGVVEPGSALPLVRAVDKISACPFVWGPGWRQGLGHWSLVGVE